MGKLLVDVVEVYVDYKRNSLGLEEEDSDAEEVMKAFKKNISQGIMKEVVHEQKQIIVQSAKKKIEEEQKEAAKQREESHIRELKVLLWEGFFIAFVVGLLVNQATDVISIFKGVLDQKHIVFTLVTITILLLLCVLMFSLEYLKKLISFFKCGNGEK